MNRHKRAAHTSAIGVGFGRATQFLALCSRSAFQENKGPATRSLKGKPWQSPHFAAFTGQSKVSVPETILQASQSRRCI